VQGKRQNQESNGKTKRAEHGSIPVKSKGAGGARQSPDQWSG
jgi:hypothetical protein